KIYSLTSLGPHTSATRLLARPDAAREVGYQLVQVAEAGSAGRAPHLIGPDELTLAEMIRLQYAHDGTSRRVLEMRFPGAYGRGLASTALRGDPSGAVIGEMTFAQWLGQEHRAG